MSARSEAVKAARRANPGMRRGERRRRAELLRARLKAMLGDECAECGATENLEFDHIDPATKRFSIAARIRDTSVALLTEEVKKCQLLCPPCHRTKSTREVPSTRENVSFLAEVRFLKEIGLGVASIAERLGLNTAQVRCLLRHEQPKEVSA